MARSRKEGKPKKNRGNVLKKEKRAKKNFDLIKEIEKSLK